MKRWQSYSVLGGLVMAGIAIAGGVWWWDRAHTLRTAKFDVPTAAPAEPNLIRLVAVAGGLEQPTDVQFVPGGGTRVVITEQAGKARLIDVGPALQGGAPVDAQAAPLALKIWARALVEMGLLSLAFHPKYQENGKMYVYYHPWVHDTLFSRIAEYTVPPLELGKTEAKESRVLMEIPQQFNMHQGGQVAFGPEGALYVGVGDGSTANDPDGNAQNLGSLRGKVVRLNVDGADIVPPDNPFVKQAGARPEVWAYGIRNPWRFSFTSKGQLVLGDVGQEAREEIDMIPAGANMGWRLREGRMCGQGAASCDSPVFVDPVHDYGRDVGGCVIGGFEVTGDRVPEIKGKYVFADFVRGRIWAMDLPAEPPAPGAKSPEAKPLLLGQWPRLFSTFGRDAAGDLYVADVATGELLALYPSEATAPKH